MKKLILNQTNFEGAEVLTREQLRKVIGGNGSGEESAPDEPAGGDEGGDGSGSGYKCCWSNSPNVCSRCVPNATLPGWSCVPGAVMTAC